MVGVVLKKRLAAVFKESVVVEGQNMDSDGLLNRSPKTLGFHCFALHDAARFAHHSTVIRCPLRAGSNRQRANVAWSMVTHAITAARLQVAGT